MHNELNHTLENVKSGDKPLVEEKWGKIKGALRTVTKNKFNTGKHKGNKMWTTPEILKYWGWETA